MRAAFEIQYFILNFTDKEVQISHSGGSRLFPLIEFEKYRDHRRHMLQSDLFIFTTFQPKVQILNEFKLIINDISAGLFCKVPGADP